MRIVITTDTVGGVWNYTCELVSGLLARQVSVLVVTLGRPMDAEQSAWAERMSAQYPETFLLQSTSFRLEWMEDAGDDVAASRAYLQQLCMEYSPDLLHTNQFCFASLDLDIPILLAVHSDVVSWWHAVHHMAPPRSEWLDVYMETVRQALAGATTVVAPTRWMLEQMHRYYGAFAHSMVIPNGCSDASMLPCTARKVQAVSLGRLWDEGKHTEILHRVQAGIPILIAGEPDSPMGSQARGFQSQPSSSVRSLGKLSHRDTKKLFFESSIYIATSRYEPFGLAPVEAAFAGCAIVANDIPSLREVWGDAALFYHKDDPASLSHALIQLTRQPALLQHYAREARLRARFHYKTSAMVARYLELYTRMLRLESYPAYA